MGSGNIRAARAPRFRAALMAALSGVMAILFLAMTFGSALLPTSSARADDGDDAKKTIKEMADSYIVKPDGGTPEDSFFQTMDKFNSEATPGRTTNTFGSVIQRLLSLQYSNQTSDGAAAGGQRNGLGGSGYNCAVDAPGAGTLLYHNCDVPNLATEAIQNIIGVVAPMGIQGGAVESATLDSAWFGLPSDIPGGGAPVDPSQRSVKYSALELYGYNLKFTNYVGEWDHIQVMTSARALSNFGFMDDMRMTVTAISKGIAGGINKAATNFLGGITSGNVFKAVGGLFSGFWSGSASAGVNSILDTSDLNVYNTYAWYRVGYGGTLYMARELSTTEVAANAKAQLVNMLSASKPDKAGVPEDLQKIEGGPPAPTDPISKCEFVDADGKKGPWGDTTMAPGPTEAMCKQNAETAFQARQNKPNPPANDKADYTWSVDGTQKGQTLVQWKEANKEAFDTAEKYNIGCELDTQESTRADNLAAFNACWPDAWSKAATASTNASQDEANSKWIDEQLGTDAFQKWVQEDPSRNFNAPWSRFVCTDASGKDLKNGTQLVMLYDSQGILNSQCNPVRPPVQNGYFGNGYLPGQAQPQPDTRWEAVDRSFFGTLFPVASVSTSLGNMGLGAATLFTRVSNSVINLTFSPVFETLGLDKMVVTLIGTFRDSIFFPLVALMVGVTGIMALWSAGKNRDYGRQAVSLLLMAGTIMSGVFLMFRPEQTVKLVDDVPSQIETAIIGSIFAVGNGTEDELCTASGTVGSAKGAGLDGQELSYSPHDATRTLMCENWRIFAFNPWVAGQWGTDFSHLYAAESGKTTRLANTNGSLVGDAAVNMGGGATVKNWALYQLDVASSGTASKRDATVRAGATDRNFYRIVDLQAGPNKGAGTDSRYFQVWSGKSVGGRLAAAFFSPIVAGVGATTVIVYSVAKIQIAFVTIIMLLLLPIMFLLGIHPTMGRMKLKAYLGTIIGLTIQRIVLVLVMAVMFRLLIGFGNLSTNYMMNALVLVTVCIAFLRLRKPLLNMVFESVSNTMGAPVGGQFATDPDGWRRNNIRGGGLVGNTLERFGTSAGAMATGAVAGYMSGGIRGMGKGASQSARYELESLKNIQRRRGFRMAETITKAASKGREDAQQKIAQTDGYDATANDALHKSKAYEQYKNDLNDWHKLEEVESDGRKVRINAAGEEVEKPTAPRQKGLGASQASRNVVKAQNVRERLDKRKERLERKTHQSEESVSRSRARFEDFRQNPGNIADHLAADREVGPQEDTRSQTRQKRRIEADEKRYDRHLRTIAKVENKFQAREAMREELSSLMSRAKDSETENKRLLERAAKRQEKADGRREESLDKARERTKKRDEQTVKYQQKLVEKRNAKFAEESKDWAPPTVETQGEDEE